MPYALCVFEKEPPLAEHIFGMGRRWSEEALDLNPIVDSMGEALEFQTVHFAAIVFCQTAF
jgi:hypothetical protein